MYASKKGSTEIVKLLLEQKGIDVNAKNIYLFCLELISTIFNFKFKFGI